MGKENLKTEYGTFFYEIDGFRAVITGFQGEAARISLPSEIEGYPVTALGRKAFLSRKGLHGVSIPDTMEEIGDWAFAHCDHLTDISVAAREIRFGRAVFKGCVDLKRIEVRRGAGNEINYAPELLAAAVTMLDAAYLLDPPAAGSPRWLEQWDLRLRDFMRTPDQDGYISQSVYGEEDYIGMDLEEYISGRRKEKARLAFLRLLHPQGVEASLKQRLEDYLRSLTKGREGEEAWQVLYREHGGDRAYYTLFAELSGITEENLEGILGDIGEDYPEMKAFFLTEGGSGAEEDFFAGLELDS